MMHILIETATQLPAAPRRSISSSSLIVILLIWCQCHITCALYLNNQQQQQQQQQMLPPIIVGNNQQQQELANNGAIIQALSQFAAQQVAGGAGGMLQAPGGLQVTATSGTGGTISINNNNNNNNNALVNSNIINNNNANNQTAVVTGTTTATGQQQQQPQGSSNQFVIKVIHNDQKNQLAYVSITPVNYTNLHQPRIELRYQSKHPFVELPESSPNNTVAAAVIVNDEDSGPNGETTLTIEQGNELGHFKLVSTGFTNTIQVNGAPLSRNRVPEYNLTIVARDHGSPPKASSSNLVIKLQPSQMSSSLQSSLGPHHTSSSYNPDPQPILKPPVTDLMYVGTMLVVMFSAVIILIIIGCALVQRPQKSKAHKGLPPTRTTSASNSRIIPPTDQCSAYCLGTGYNLTNL